MGSLVERYDSVRLVWRHFPAQATCRRGADLAAELSEFGAAEGRFWEAHALLLAGRDRFTRGDSTRPGKGWGSIEHAVSRTLDKRLLRGRVCSDATGGTRAGVRGTPAFFLNGRRLEGHWRNLATLVPRMLARL